jgi:hypothetical protein
MPELDRIAVGAGIAGCMAAGLGFACTAILGVE